MPLEPHPTDPDKMVYKAHPAAKVVLDGGPAFPSIYDDHEGLSIRDYFAAKAMPAVMADWLSLGELQEDPSISRSIARDCYTIADAMLAAREEEL